MKSVLSFKTHLLLESGVSSRCLPQTARGPTSKQLELCPCSACAGPRPRLEQASEPRSCKSFGPEGLQSDTGGAGGGGRRDTGVQQPQVPHLILISKNMGFMGNSHFLPPNTPPHRS